MTNNLQDRFREKFNCCEDIELTCTDEDYCILCENKDDLLAFVVSEVERAKKELINQILSEAPEDRNDVEWQMICDSKELKGFNQCNQIWKDNLTKLK